MTAEHVNLNAGLDASARRVARRDGDDADPVRAASESDSRTRAASSSPTTTTSMTTPSMMAMDAQSVRLLLTGGSVVDWRRLAFEHPEQVARFLDVSGYAIDDEDEMARFWALHARAVGYVTRTFDVDLPGEVRRPDAATDLFLLASAEGGQAQRAACVVLKIMHVLNHLEARRLAYVLSISERAMFEAAARRFGAHIERMRTDGLALLGYEQSTKTEHSLITKLVSKPRVTAAQIFDKLRFRLITRQRDELVPVMVWLTRHLLPFSQIIPGESHNTILSEEELARALHPFGDLSEVTLAPPGLAPPAAANPATAREFGMINFVVDLPLRVRPLCRPDEAQHLSQLGHLVFVTLELQLFDRDTYGRNMHGDASHGAYKQRQRQVVARRLWGPNAPDLKG